MSVHILYTERTFTVVHACTLGAVYGVHSCVVQNNLSELMLEYGTVQEVYGLCVHLSKDRVGDEVVAAVEERKSSFVGSLVRWFVGSLVVVVGRCCTKSSFAVRRSPFAVRRSPFAVRRSPIAVRRSMNGRRHNEAMLPQ